MSPISRALSGRRPGHMPRALHADSNRPTSLRRHRAQMVRSGAAPAGLLRRALSQRPLAALLHRGDVGLAHARCDQGGACVGRACACASRCQKRQSQQRRSSSGRMTLAQLVVATALAATLATLLGLAPARAAGDLKTGEELLTKNCGACHAVGRGGDSPQKDAPAFRTLGKRYPIELPGRGAERGHHVRTS